MTSAESARRGRLVRVEYEMDRPGHDSAAERAARLWREHRPWVAAMLLAHRPRGVDVDDLLQEVAMTLVRHIDTIESPEKIGPWLRTVAMNVARDAGRRDRTKQRVFTEQPLPIESRAALPGRDHAASDAHERGRSAMRIAQSLPPEYREPIMLSLRGLSYKQISRVLELPVSTIETRLFRARAMVRDELIATERLQEARAERSPCQPAAASRQCACAKSNHHSEERHD